MVWVVLNLGILLWNLWIRRQIDAQMWESQVRHLRTEHALEEAKSLMQIALKRNLP
jgi:hypothetical protein